jgi:hypothetical protein
MGDIIMLYYSIETELLSIICVKLYKTLKVIETLLGVLFSHSEELVCLLSVNL